MLFYGKLEQRGFLELADQIQSVLDEFAIMNLHGTRVIDKLLMLTGAERGQERSWAEQNIIQQCHGFLNLLPDSWKRPVEELAEAVDSRIDPSDL